MSDLDCDPLLKHIHAVLHLLPEAEQAVDSLVESGDLKRSSLTASLSDRLSARRIFGSRDLFDLDTLLDPVHTTIEAEWVEEFLADQHCPAGGWTRHVRTSRGADLVADSEPLFQLRNALRQVRDLRHAETLAQELRAQDFNKTS